MSAAPRVTETAETIAIEGEGYRLLLDRCAPRAELAVGGRAVAALDVASGLDATDALDDDTRLGPPALHREPDAAVVTWRGASARWPAKEVELRAWAGGFSYGYAVEGHGALDRAHFFRTRAAPAPARAVRLFNPEPNSGMVQYTGQRCGPRKRCVICHPDPVLDADRPPVPADFATISVGRDKLFHDGNWFFTPAPFCYAVEGGGNWLACGVAAQPGDWNFAEFRYPGDGFGFSLVYDGHARARGAWRSPRLVCLPAADEFAAVARYCDWLRAAGLTPDHGRGPIREWWREPIFCGWGEQVSEEWHWGPPPAAARARQANNERWLGALAAHGISPGTVTIDDKWQRAYGLNDVDTAKWPDLPGFIRGQHARGRHVLLWLKAWDPEGLPPDECLLSATGRPAAVDPGNPAYRARLAAQVASMLRDLDADGFKIDFTHLLPLGPCAGDALQPWAEERVWERAPVTPSAGGHWGLELLRAWLEVISTAAREAKPDALVMAHAANPYLADLIDVLRLNDVAETADPRASVVPDMRRRARVARAASPYWLLDADNWPTATRAQWRDYVRAQATGDLGVPSLYHAERFGWLATDEALTPEDYATVRAVWAEYRAGLDEVGQAGGRAGGRGTGA
ncbi:MAG TPA: hypothetical protein VFL91_23200 [Thermomicrobiales bacterium]|nr:hypothetical protein [Thermomicrobiales bacterium]